MDWRGADVTTVPLELTDDATVRAALDSVPTRWCISPRWPPTARPTPTPGMPGP